MLRATEGRLRNNLSAYIDDMLGGEEVLLERGGSAVAVMRAEQTDVARRPGVPGTAKSLIDLREDFDAPLEDFRDYM